MSKMFHLSLFVIVFLFFGTTNIHGATQTAPLPTIKGRLLTPEEGCGFTKVKTPRINASNTKPGDYPWMALIGFHSISNGTIFKCSGTLITSRHVLTAARCFRRKSIDFVRLGEHNKTSPKDGDHQDIKVVRIAKHPDFTKKYGHDIAVLFLERDVKYTVRVRPICLPVFEPIRSQSFINSNPFVAGWATCKNCTAKSILQQTQMPIHHNQFCTELYEKFGTVHRVFPDSVICAGSLIGDESECVGDYGGPLTLPMYDNGKFPFYQIGIISFGMRCGMRNAPHGFTSTQYFGDWIQAMVNRKYPIVHV